MKKLLIGGSPCTYWSVAQKKNREVEAEGLGWELFKNYLMAKEKFKPDFFLYENNKSAAQAIKDQISQELGVELMHINSALVSAQNRQRFYAFNWNVEQPEDRGILLKDILETSISEACTLYALNTTTDGKAQCMVAVPLKVGEIGNGGQGNRIYSIEGKSVAQTATSGGMGANTGLYAVPFNPTKDGKSHTVTASYGKISEQPSFQFRSERDRQRVVQTWNGEEKPIYEVKDGQIEIKGKAYPIKLPDGLYIIRKLTPTECERLQTLPDGYTAAVSNTQRYKGLGNGWTAEVIIHILNGALKDVPRDEEIVVLSMYDGIGTGRYCLEKMGFTNVTYYAYEIDKPAMKVALSNYPDIIEMGDAFALRDDGWELGKRIQPEETTETATEDEKPVDKATDLSDAPEGAKRKIIENAEALEASEAQEEPKQQDKTKSSGPAVPFDATEQLRKLADERRALANIHPDTDRFTNDILAIEYAVKVLEAMAI